MKRIFVLAMIAMFLFVPLSHADVKTALTADGNQALFSLLFNENKESSVSTQGDAEAASTIPRIGGNWNSTGAGTIGGERFTLRGTASVVSHIDSDGYEVLTNISETAQIFDAQGRLVDSGTENQNVNYKITSRSFSITNGDVRDSYTIESDTRVTRRRTGYSGGYAIDFTFLYTRGSDGGGSSSGGGCSAVTGSPLSHILLLLPLFFLFLRKEKAVKGLRLFIFFAVLLFAFISSSSFAYDFDKTASREDVYEHLIVATHGGFYWHSGGIEKRFFLPKGFPQWNGKRQDVRSIMGNPLGEVKIYGFDTDYYQSGQQKFLFVYSGNKLVAMAFPSDFYLTRFREKMFIETPEWRNVSDPGDSRDCHFADFTDASGTRSTILIASWIDKVPEVEKIKSLAFVGLRSFAREVGITKR